jgi:hypothetical protein
MFDINDEAAIAERLSRQAVKVRFRVTAHAHQEMVEESIVLDDVISVLRRATVIENYPDHKRGPCCLVYGQDKTGRNLHVVCTTSLESAIIITVYEPKPPKWRTPFARGKRE